MNPNLILRQIRQHLSLRDGECHKCKDARRKLFVCSSCRAVSYCGVECQRKHWTQHQLICARTNQSVTFGALPRDVIQMIAKFLPRKDLLNLKLVNKWISKHPRIISKLQNEYFYRVRALEDIARRKPIDDWTRGIRKIIYSGNDQQIVNQIPEYFNSTNVLYLNLSSFTGDISPLRKLKNLENLDLEEFNGNDIEVLGELKKLQILNIPSFNGVSVKPLSELRQLQELHLNGFTGDNISPLSELRQLQVLSLDDFTGDISPLGRLQQLQTLSLQDFTGDNIDPLSGLRKLQVLTLNNFNGDSIEPLSGLTQLRVLYLNSFDGGSIGPLSELTQLQRLYLNSFRGDISPLRELTQLQVLTLPYTHPYSDDWKEYLSSLN